MIELFEIGVSLTMQNGVSGVLGVIQRDLLGMRGHLTDLEGGFGRLRVAALGLTGVLAGGGVLGAMWKIGEAGAKQVTIEERLLTAGMKRAEIEQMTAKAWELAQTKRDESSTNYLEMMAEMRNALPDTAEVLKLAPLSADFLTDIRMGHPGADTHGMLQDAIKTLSMRGRLYHPGTRDLDEEGIRNELDWMGRATRFTNGQQNPASFRQMASQAGPAARGMSAEAFYGFGAEVANTLGASKAGTALSSLFQQFQGGTMPKWVAQNLLDADILKKGTVTFAKGGHANFDPNKALDDAKGMTENPFQWLSKEIHSYAAGHHLSEQQAAYKILGRATTQRLGSDVQANLGELQNAYEKQRQAMGIEATAAEARKNDPANLKAQFHSAIEDMEVAVGKSLWDPAHDATKSDGRRDRDSYGDPETVHVAAGVFNEALHTVVGGIRDAIAWVKAPDNQAAIATILKVTAAVSAFLVVAGGLTVVSMAFTALAPVLAPLAIGAGLAYAAFRMLGTAGLEEIGQCLRDLGSRVRATAVGLRPYAVAFGSALMGIVGWVRDVAIRVRPFVEQVGGGLLGLSTHVQAFWERMRPVFAGMGESVSSILSHFGGGEGGMLEKVLGALGPAVVKVAGFLLDLSLSIAEFAAKGLAAALRGGEILANLTASIVNFVSSIADLPGKITGLIGGLASGVGNAARGAIDGARNALGFGGASASPGGASHLAPPPDAARVGSVFVPPPGVAPVSFTSNLVVDGRQMASVVNRANARTAALPDTGGTGYDHRVSMPSSAGNT